MSRKFPGIWFVGLDKKDKEDFEYALRNSIVLERLEKILREKIDGLEIPSLESYDKSAWPYYRADMDGQLRAYREILKLFDQKGKHNE
jgi:hypothetical protein